MIVKYGEAKIERTFKNIEEVIENTEQDTNIKEDEKKPEETKETKETGESICP